MKYQTLLSSALLASALGVVPAFAAGGGVGSAAGTHHWSAPAAAPSGPKADALGPKDATGANATAARPLATAIHSDPLPPSVRTAGAPNPQTAGATSPQPPSSPQVTNPQAASALQNGHVFRVIPPPPDGSGVNTATVQPMATATGLDPQASGTQNPASAAAAQNGHVFRLIPPPPRD